MSLKSILARWKADPAIGPNIAAWKVIPPKSASWSPFPQTAAPDLAAELSQRGIRALYKHQREAWDLIQAGRDLVLATGTASGKSLAYQLPILNTRLLEPGSTALLLFPTKALARDQLGWLNHFSFSKTYPYDGDTPQDERSTARQSGRVIVSNPDMLHLGILPYHTNWSEFLANLRYVVIDEIHVYRGVFGSHVANVLRRLDRLAAHYGAQPQYILTSATIGNPRQLAEKLAGRKFDLIDQDHSSQGEKHFLIYNPPLIDPELGLRASMQRESVRLAEDLLGAKLQTIIFGRSRRTVEFLLTELRGRIDLPRPALQSYRSGYLPQQRREIEAEIRSGRILGITATTALELGIDIGCLDCAILAGYPGTISGSWQQAGRAGRTEAPSLAVLVASASPLDQYLASHPEFLLDRNPEKGLIDPDNLLLLLAHLQCAAYELPFDQDSTYGGLSNPETVELLDAIQQLGNLHSSQGKYYWMSAEYPAAAISLRSISADQIQLLIVLDDGTRTTLGTIDYESALWMVHPGAIYLHSGETYLVTRLDLETRKAELQPVENDFYTEAEKETNFKLLNLRSEAEIAGGIIQFGDILVSSQVIGFKRITWNRRQILGRDALELPASELNTVGFWLTISEKTEAQLRDSGLWSSSPNDYGPDWPSIRQIALERDQHRCQSCGVSHSEVSLQIHHKQPLRSYLSFHDANQLTNLITLCPSCHQRAEAVVRVQSGIRGLGYIFHSLAPLLLMCDPGDLGLYTDFRSPFTSDRPIALLYENIPAGIGFSSQLFARYGELLHMAYQTVDSCPCSSGCPSCVGPGGDQGSGGKPETQAILEALSSAKPAP